jgi:hypothetical protein
VNWQTVAVLVLIFSGIAMLHARTLARRRRIFLILWLVVALLVYRWANFRQAWGTIGIAAGLSTLITGLWWLLIGRKLPKPVDDNIRVWSKDDPF